MKIAVLDKALPSKWLQLALLVTVALTLWAFLQGDESEGEAEVEAVGLVDKRAKTFVGDANTEQQFNADAQAAVIDWQKLKRSPLPAKVENPFKVHSWLVVPPVKKVKPAPPPIPAAPPAPFTYMGKYEESPNKTQIFLLANNKLYSAIAGKNIDTEWRLDNEDANSLSLTYLPLNLPQVLSKLAIPMAPEIMPAAAPVSAEVNL